MVGGGVSATSPQTNSRLQRPKETPMKWFSERPSIPKTPAQTNQTFTVTAVVDDFDGPIKGASIGPKDTH